MVSDTSYQALVEMTSEFLNLNGARSEVNEILENNKADEAARLTIYRYVIIFVGLIVLVTNLLVVVSSGLILKKGPQPKSTYILLGNISLADMFAGLFIIMEKIFSNLTTSDMLCIFQTGMLVCSTVTSTYSVGLIAVDRYIYILHGMYYRCWVNTTKVRICIIFTWIIGIVLGFLPAAGWVNEDELSTVCSYTALFPGPLILLISGLSMLSIIVVAILNFIILVRALRKIKEIKANIKVKPKTHEKNEMKIYRGNHSFDKNPQLVKSSPKNDPAKIKRSISFNAGCDNMDKSKIIAVYVQKYKSNEDFLNVDDLQSHVGDIDNLENVKSKNGVNFDSKVSICTLVHKVSESKNVNNIESNTKKILKSKEPNKWRAITVVMLTSGSIIVTWVPFYIAVIFFVFCEEKLTNPKCSNIRILLRGPLAIMTFISSMLNPLIYAWWHKGFQRSVKLYFQRYILQLFIKNTNQ